MYIKKTIAVLIFGTMFLGAVSAAAATGPEIKKSPDRLANAGLFARQGNIEQAVEQYQLHYAENPDKHSTLQYIAQLYENSKRFVEAVECREKFLVSGDEHLTRGAHFKDCCDRIIGLWEKIGGDRSKGAKLAREHYQAILDDENAKPRMTVVAHLMLGDLVRGSRDASQSREHYLSAFNLVLAPADDWQKTVNKVLLRNFTDQRQCADALTVYNNYPDYQFIISLGQWLRQQGRGLEMVELYEDYLFAKNVTLDGSYMFGLDDYGLACKVIDELTQVGQGEKLAEKFDALPAARSAASRIYRNYAYLLYKIRRTDECLAQIEKFLAANKSPSAADYKLAGDLCEKGAMINEAIKYYEVARNTEVTDREVLGQSMYSQMGAPQDYWKTRYKIRILEALGKLYMKTNNLKSAEECFKEIVELQTSRKNDNAEASLAKIWDRTAKENTLVKELKAKVDAAPDNAKLRVEYAETLSRAGKLAQTIEQLAKAVELDGDNLSVRIKYADALAKNKQNAQAIVQYEKVLFSRRHSHNKCDTKW